MSAHFRSSKEITFLLDKFQVSYTGYVVFIIIDLLDYVTGIGNGITWAHSNNTFPMISREHSVSRISCDFLHKFDQQERENQVFLCNKENTIAIYITTALKYYRSIHNYCY